MKYWIIHLTAVVGPFEPSQLEAMSAFDGSSLVCPETSTGFRDTDWVRAETVVELAKGLAERPAPRPWNARGYWVHIDGIISGPFFASQLWELPGFDANAIVCPQASEGADASEWLRAVDCLELLQPSAGRPPGSIPAQPDPGAPSGADQSMSAMGSKIEETDQSVDRLRRQVEELGGGGEAFKAVEESARVVDQMHDRYEELEARLADLKAQSGESSSEVERGILATFEELSKVHRTLENRLAQLEGRLQAPLAAAPEPASGGLGSAFGGGGADFSLGGDGGFSLDGGGMSLGGGEGLSLGGGEGLSLGGGEGLALGGAEGMSLGGPALTAPSAPVPDPAAPAEPPVPFEFGLTPPPAPVGAEESPAPSAPESAPPPPPFPPAAELIKTPSPAPPAVPEPAPPAARPAPPEAPPGSWSWRPLMLGAAAGVIISGFLWSRRLPGPAAVERAPAASALPAPEPAPVVESDADLLKAVRAFVPRWGGEPLGARLEAALAAPDFDVDRMEGRWSLTAPGSAGLREARFRSDRLDPETGKPLVYRFEFDAEARRVRGLNLPARAILSEP